MFNTNVVLSPYTNPPYRPPTAATTTTNDNPANRFHSPSMTSESRLPSTGPSPKRKRSHSAASAEPTSSTSAPAPAKPIQRPSSLISQPSAVVHQAKRPSLAPTGFDHDLLNANPESCPTSGADSPRSKVAARFQALHLRSSSASTSLNENHGLDGSGTISAEGSRGNTTKRAKREVMRKESAASSSVPSPSPLSSLESEAEDETVREISEMTPVQISKLPRSTTSIVPETPQGHDLTAPWHSSSSISSPPSSPHSPIPRSYQGLGNPHPSSSPSNSKSQTTPITKFTSNNTNTDRNSSTSPTLKESTTPSTAATKALPPPPSSPPLNPSNNPSQASLTWQDSEITGHEIDFASGEDDGEGINGIGFKPTPAMAYARKQRRRQQVSDWRAREAREERLKRMERRRGAAGSGGGRREEGVEGRADAERRRRAVRFADVG